MHLYKSLILVGYILVRSNIAVGVQDQAPSISNLPAECLKQVWSKLDPKTCLAVACVCQEFKNLSMETVEKDPSSIDMKDGRKRYLQQVLDEQNLLSVANIDQIHTRLNFSKKVRDDFNLSFTKTASSILIDTGLGLEQKQEKRDHLFRHVLDFGVRYRPDGDLSPAQILALKMLYIEAHFKIGLRAKDHVWSFLKNRFEGSLTPDQIGLIETKVQQDMWSCPWYQGIMPATMPIMAQIFAMTGSAEWDDFMAPYSNQFAAQVLTQFPNSVLALVRSDLELSLDVSQVETGNGNLLKVPFFVTDHLILVELMAFFVSTHSPEFSKLWDQLAQGIEEFFEPDVLEHLLTILAQSKNEDLKIDSFLGLFRS